MNTVSIYAEIHTPVGVFTGRYSGEIENDPGVIEDEITNIQNSYLTYDVVTIINGEAQISLPVEILKNSVTRFYAA
jgi:hypothetical protein